MNVNKYNLIFSFHYDVFLFGNKEAKKLRRKGKIKSQTKSQNKTLTSQKGASHIREEKTIEALRRY